MFRKRDKGFFSKLPVLLGARKRKKNDIATSLHVLPWIIPPIADWLLVEALGMASSYVGRDYERVPFCEDCGSARRVERSVWSCSDGD